MFNMRLVLLNDSFTDVEEVSFAEEIVKIKKYNEVGECKLKVGCDQEIVDLIRSCDYVIDYDHSDEYVTNGNVYVTFDIYKFNNISINTTVNQGDYLNVVARDCLSILEDRAIINPIVHSGHPVDLLLALFNDCYAINDSDMTNSRKSSKVIIDEESFRLLREAHEDDVYTGETDAENNLTDLLSRVLEICQAFDYGIKVRYCPDLGDGKFIVSVYSGKEQAVVFSPMFKNISDTEYTETRSYKNVAIVKGQSGKAVSTSSEDTTPIVTVWEDYPNNEPSGDDRREVIIDAASACNREFKKETLTALYPNVTAVAQMDNDGTKGKLYDAYYIPLLINYGIETLKSLRSESTFSGELEIDNMYEYTVDYNLGDIVVAKNIYNLGADNVRIIEMWESRDVTGVDVLEPKFRW